LHVDIEERASGPGLLIDGERATSAASSSLDPYYFGLATGQANSSKPVTPDVPRAYEPVTPAKDAATIDRRGLVGVGELTTPRWVKQSSTETNDHDHDSDDLPDSPWTIEAVDGELDDPEDLKDQVCVYH
jgi:dual specificity tyrosine-phosphorylation-regulated kinase 2/3/4